MTTPRPIGAMSSNRVILGELLSTELASASPANLSLQHQLPFVTTNAPNGTQGLLALSVGESRD